MPEEQVDIYFAGGGYGSYNTGRNTSAQRTSHHQGNSSNRNRRSAPSQKSNSRKKHRKNKKRFSLIKFILFAAVIGCLIYIFPIMSAGRKALSDTDFFIAVSSDAYGIQGYDLMTTSENAAKAPPVFTQADKSEYEYSVLKYLALTFDTGKNIKKAKKKNINLFIKCEATGAENAAIGVEHFIISDKKAQNNPIEIVTPITQEMLSTVGAYKITLKCGSEYINSILLVVDTTAPTAEVIEAVSWKGGHIKLEQITQNVNDISDVEIVFTKPADMQQLGTQEIEFYLTDTSGNKSPNYSTTVEIKEDIEPPIIIGAQDRLIALGDTVSYKDGISVTDNKDDNVELIVDSSAVNPYEEGDYDVIYKATDSTGNHTEMTVTFSFKEEEGLKLEREVKQYASEILSDIINESDTQREKAKAIFDWVKANIGYSGSADKDSGWIKGAHDGFKKRSGDCYTYFAVSKALLNEASIKNTDVEKIEKEGRSRHYWSLIDVGSGWYHFDVTPRKGSKDKIFLWTDEKLLKFSKSHDDSHDFDSSLYPATPKTEA